MWLGLCQFWNGVAPFVTTGIWFGDFGVQQFSEDVLVKDWVYARHGWYSINEAAFQSSIRPARCYFLVLRFARIAKHWEGRKSTFAWRRRILLAKLERLKNACNLPPLAGLLQHLEQRRRLAHPCDYLFFTFVPVQP